MEKGRGKPGGLSLSLLFPYEGLLAQEEPFVAVDVDLHHAGVPFHQRRDGTGLLDERGGVPEYDPALHSSHFSLSGHIFRRKWPTNMKLAIINKQVFNREACFKNSHQISKSNLVSAIFFQVILKLPTRKKENCK